MLETSILEAITAAYSKEDLKGNTSNKTLPSTNNPNLKELSMHIQVQKCASISSSNGYNALLNKFLSTATPQAGLENK